MRGGDRPSEERGLKSSPLGVSSEIIQNRVKHCQSYTQISAIDHRQKAYCNDGVILLTDDAINNVDDDLTEDCGIGDRLTCKRSCGGDPTTSS